MTWKKWAELLHRWTFELVDGNHNYYRYDLREHIEPEILKWQKHSLDCRAVGVIDKHRRAPQVSKWKVLQAHGRLRTWRFLDWRWNHCVWKILSLREVVYRCEGRMIRCYAGTHGKLVGTGARNKRGMLGGCLGNGMLFGEALMIWNDLENGVFITRRIQLVIGVAPGASNYFQVIRRRCLHWKVEGRSLQLICTNCLLRSNYVINRMQLRLVR